MSRILFMGAPYEIPSYETQTAKQNFERTGFNTGNLLIGNGLYSQLHADTIEMYAYRMTPDYIQNNFDLIVIAAANFLYRTFDFTPYSSVLEKVDLPVTMIGLGAQLPSINSTFDKNDLIPGTWRLVEIASDRSSLIGVRGDFTAEALSSNGIKNVQVTGCPSLYTYNNLATKIQQVKNLDPKKIAVNGSRNVSGHSFDENASIRIEHALLNYAVQHKSPFVLQNEMPEILLSREGYKEEFTQEIDKLSKAFNLSKDDFIEHHEKQSKTFFTIKDWFNWIKKYNFSIGTRFHGNLAALLNGVPAMILVHDSRTRELCEFSSIPHKLINEITEFDPVALFENANYEQFNKRYKEIYTQYIIFLDKNNIPHKLKPII